jgi:hypothetical protein
LSAVGQLGYASFTARPDIAFHSAHLATFGQDPSSAHLNAALRTIRYLARTQSFGILYSSTPSADHPSLQIFCDSDWGADITTRRSVTGIVTMFNGSAIDWSSKRQSLVAGSSNEAELAALASATKQAQYIQQLLLSVGFAVSQVPLLTDSLTSIDLVNGISLGRTKHQSIRLFQVRFANQQHQIVLRHVTSDEQLADPLTKPLPVSKFTSSVSRLICSPPN